MTFVVFVDIIMTFVSAAAFLVAHEAAALASTEKDAFSASKSSFP